MADLKKILVVEDELTNAILLKRVLSKAGYSILVSHNGIEALHHLEHDKFDAILTDWMMPQVDGIELIRRLREMKKELPLIIMITALVSEGAKSYALESGADDFIAKPIDVDELLTRLKDGLERHSQESPTNLYKPVVTREIDVHPEFVSVVIGTSTGGPPTLIEMFRNITESLNAAYFIVQHGPPWMLETFSQRLQRSTKLKVSLASNNMKTEAGNIYIAPGDRHMRIEAETYNIVLDDGPKENFVRPAADPLFRSAADAFGKYCIAVVLTGLGRDAAQGTLAISSVKGSVVIQDPETSVAPSMPNTAIDTQVPHRLAAMDELGKTVSETIFPLAALLKQNQKDKSK